MNPESRLVASAFDSPNLTESESCKSRVQNFQPSVKPSLIFLDSVQVGVCGIGLGECARQTILRNDELGIRNNDALPSGTRCNIVIHTPTHYCARTRWNYEAHADLVLYIDCLIKFLLLICYC